MRSHHPRSIRFTGMIHCSTRAPIFLVPTVSAIIYGKHLAYEAFNYILKHVGKLPANFCTAYSTCSQCSTSCYSLPLAGFRCCSMHSRGRRESPPPADTPEPCASYRPLLKSRRRCSCPPRAVPRRCRHESAADHRRLFRLWHRHRHVDGVRRSPRARHQHLLRRRHQRRGAVPGMTHSTVDCRVSRKSREKTDCDYCCWFLTKYEKKTMVSVFP